MDLNIFFASPSQNVAGRAVVHGKAGSRETICTSNKKKVVVVENIKSYHVTLEMSINVGGQSDGEKKYS